MGVLFFACEKTIKDETNEPLKFCWKCVTKLSESKLQGGVRISYSSTTIANVTKCEMTELDARSYELKLTNIETSINGYITTVKGTATVCTKK